MKKIFISLLVCFPAFSFCQQKDIYDTAAEKICDYMNKHSEKKINSEAEAKAFFSMAFMDACMPYIDRLLEKEGLKTFDEQSGRKIGEKISLKLSATCPKFMEVMQPVVKQSLKDDNDSETGSLNGIVTEITQDGYTFLKLKLADGSQKRVVWLLSFDDAENINNDPKKLVGKKWEIQWKSVRLFYPKSNSFGTEKMITGLKQQ
jgi:hypothetical protein